MLLDPAAAHPELGHLRSALSRSDWPACRRLLDGCTPIGRTTLLSWAAQERTIGELLRYVHSVDPSDGTAAALLALNLIDIGWQARTRSSAARVSRRQFEEFHEWLRRAESVLIDAAALHPDDPAIWTARLMTARGLELGLDESRRRYGALTAADPYHLPGQAQFLQNICPKWGGTWAEVHAFAAASMHAAPPGSPQGVLVAEAHFEHSLGPDAGKYWNSPAVKESVYQAAQRSVWDPGFRRDPGWVQTAGTFALAFSRIGDPRAAASMFAMTGDFADPFPWRYFTDDVPRTVETYRKKALAGAR